MSYPISAPQVPAPGRWPVTSDSDDRATRPDVVAAVLMIVAGAAGIAQLWVPWLRDGAASATGWDVFQNLKQGLDVHRGFAPTIGAYAVLAVVVLGVALVLLGVLMLVRLDHRPPGIVAVLAGLLGVLCAVWWVFWHGGAGELGQMFSTGWIGWYLFLVSGLLGLVGAIKALVSST
jgi:hypothetical protein